MNKKTEKDLEKKVGKRIGDKIKKEVDKEVEKEVKEKVDRVEKEIKKEVEKQLHLRLFEEAKSTALAFKKEFRNQMVVAITAAFAFLLALSWRTPIQGSLNNVMAGAGLTGDSVLVGYLSALLITLVGVLVLMWISKWKVDKE